MILVNVNRLCKFRRKNDYDYVFEDDQEYKKVELMIHDEVRKANGRKIKILIKNGFNGKERRMRMWKTTYAVD